MQRCQRRDVVEGDSIPASPFSIPGLSDRHQFLFLGLGAWWFAPFPDRAVWWLLIASAGLSAASIMALSWAYGRAEAQVLVPLEYTAFIWAAIVGWFAFAEPVTMPMLIGVALRYILRQPWILVFSSVAQRKRTGVQHWEAACRDLAVDCVA